jgi:probable phosphoglycerate mutase
MTVATELVLARHGESNCNVAGIAGGERGCSGLSPRGRQQVRRLAARLAGEHEQQPFHAFYGSPRRRVRETADIIGAALGLEAVVVDDLRHLDHGDADGRPWYEINRDFGGPAQDHPDRPIAPGAESWHDFLDRSSAALRRILDRHAGQRVLIAAHGETVEVAHVLLLRLPAAVQPDVGFLTDNAAITRWQQHIGRFSRPVWMLAAHNDRHHLG